MQKQTRDLLLLLVIGILVGASSVMVWSSRHSRTETPNDSSTFSGINKGAAAPSGTSTSAISPSALFPLPPSIPANTRVGLSVPDQPAGNVVSVSNLSIVGTKWVAIYDDHEGRPGWILGASRVHEGDKETSVPLLRPEGTISGGTYYAAILNDDGDEEFNRLTDLPPLSPEKVTIVRFSAT